MERSAPVPAPASPPATVDAAAPPSPVTLGPGARRGEHSLQELMTLLRDETVHATRGEMDEMSDVITDGVTNSDAKILELEPAYVASSASAPLDKRGLPRMDVIKAPLPPMPYMMEPEREPMYAIRAFTPLWKELKLERNAFTTVIQGLRVMVSKWNHNEDKGETHVALNQGKLHVPWGKATKLLHAGLAAALQTGSECWITEIKTLWYRYFTDLDFVQPEKLAPRQIEALVLVVQRAVRRFFPGKHADDPLFYAVVCSTSYKPVFASKDDERLYTIGVEARKKLEAPGPHLSDALVRELSAKIAAMPAHTAWKTGVHVIWVNLYVNNAMALYMRETIIYDLADTFGVRAEPMNDWMDVVDVTVYKKSGLRMVGNRKSDPCSQCKGAHRVGPPAECAYCAENKHHCTVKLHWVRLKKADAEAKLGDVCPTCEGNGRVDTGRPYMPMFVVDSQGYRRPELEDVYRRDFVRLINDTAIRWRGVPWRDSSRAERDRAKLRADMAAAHDEDDAAAAAAALEATHALTYVYEQPRGQGWAVYSGAPQPVSLKLVTGADGLEHYVEEEADLSKAVSRKKKAAGGAGAGAGVEDDATAKALAGASEPKGMNIVLLRTDPLAATLQDFIRANAGTMHCELAVTRVATNRDRTAYFVNVHGPNCHYCHNVGREHGSNRIYFMFTNDGMWQRCHKRGPRTAEMKYSACESYRSAPVTLPQDLRAALFPHVAAKLSAMGVSASRGYGAVADDAATAAAAAGDVVTATQYDPTCDVKTNTLMDVGDVLAMQLHSTAWSPTLKMPDGRHMARTRTHAADAEFVARSAMLMTSGFFVSVNFADLGQNAADAMQRLGFNTADDMPAQVHTPTTTFAFAEGGGGGGAGGMLSSLADALTGSYEEDAPVPALVHSAAAAAASGPEDKPRLSIQRLHALLLRQVAAVIDAAVALPSATVTECITTGGMSAVVDAFRLQRRARPIVIESMDARIARIATAAADALAEGKGRDLAVWMSAIEECRTARDKEQVCDAAARWRMYWEAHPDAEPHAAAAHVRTRGALPYPKRKRDDGVRPAAIVVRAPTGPRFKSLREVKDN